MISKLLAFAGVLTALFYCMVPLLYLFPRIATHRITGKTMLLMAFLVVIPTGASLLVRLCCYGLKARTTYRTLPRRL